MTTKLSMATLDERLRRVEVTLLDMKLGLDDYEGANLGWFAVLGFWHESLKRFAELVDVPIVSAAPGDPSADEAEAAVKGRPPTRPFTPDEEPPHVEAEAPATPEERVDVS